MSDPDSVENLLFNETSRRNTDLVAGLIYEKPDLFNDIARIMLKNEEPFSRRAAWVMDTVSEQNPSLLEPWIPAIVDMLEKFSHDGMKRHSLRMLSRSEFPVASMVKIMNLCFDWLISPSESVAVKVYCMDLLYRISLSESGIREELRDSIEWRISEETPGFRNHGMKILKKLSKDLRDLHSAKEPAKKPFNGKG
ncbi:MAG: hypothetical protein Q8867_05725 [Bacteroidota bacterium]|nr:hypothetical protein [Bacteroidota bacterium]